MSVSDTPALDAFNASVSNPASMFHEAERLRSKARHDEAQALYNNERKTKFEIARKLLNRNRPIDEIIDDTGLTREEAENLRS